MGRIATQLQSINPYSLWFSILGGPVTWFVHFSAIYSIVDFGCDAAEGDALSGGPESLKLLILIATGVALIITVAALIVGMHNRGQATSQEEASAQRQQFMIRLGIILSGLFTVVIIVTTVPTLVLPICSGIVE